MWIKVIGQILVFSAEVLKRWGIFKKEKLTLVRFGLLEQGKS
jgi:hypothetical protein